MPKEDPFVNRAELLKAIKKYPEIWDSNNKLHMCRSVTAPMWNEIADQFGGHVPTVKLQSIWSQMKYHYHNLVHRQILHKDRFTTKWEHFEPMSFMHSITVAKIVGTGSSIPAGSTGTANSMELNLIQSQPPLLPQSQGRGRPSGSFTWLPPLTVQPELNADPAAPFSAFTGLVPPAAVTVETSTTPLRKPGRPGSLNNSMRGRIIEAIKARPLLWSGRQKTDQKGHNRTSAIWKEVATELCLTPSLVQTRWSIIKQRYVDELQKERHARYVQESFHSNWEHFERMSFMRDILVKKVDEREQTREQIQGIVHEKQQMQNIQQQHHHQQEQQPQESHHQHLHNYDGQHLRYIRNSLGNGTSETHMLPSPLPPHHLVSVDAHNRAIHSQHLHHLHALSMCNENTNTNNDNNNSNNKNSNSNSHDSGSGSGSNCRSSSTSTGGTSNSRINNNNNNNNSNNNNGEHNHLTVHNQSLSGNGIVGAGSIMSLMPHQTVVSYTGGTRSTNNRRVKHVNDLEWDSFEMMLHVQNAADAAAAANAAAAATAAAAAAAAAVNN